MSTNHELRMAIAGASEQDLRDCMKQLIDYAESNELLSKITPNMNDYQRGMAQGAEDMLILWKFLLLGDELPVPEDFQQQCVDLLGGAD